ARPSAASVFESYTSRGVSRAHCSPPRFCRRESNGPIREVLTRVLPKHAQLRAADGENCRPSPARLRISTESGPSLAIVGTCGPEEYFIPILVQNPQAIGLLRHVQCLEERFGFHFHRLQIGTALLNPIQRSVRVVF